MIGIGIGSVSAVAVGLIGLGGLVSLVGVKALVGHEHLLSRLVVGLGLALLIGMAAGLIIALVGSLMGFGSEVNASGLGGLGVGLVVGLIAGLLARAALVRLGGLGGLSNQEGFVVRLSAGWGSGIVAGVVWGLVMGIVGLSGLGGPQATFVVLATVCPTGHPSIEEYELKDAPERVEVHFAGTTCEPCPLRSRCPVKLDRRAGAYVLKANLVKVNIERRRRAEATEEWRKRYGIRAGIEGTNSELKRAHGLGRLRVRGGRRVRLAVYLKALACNFKRMVHARLVEMENTAQRAVGTVPAVAAA